MTLSPKNINIQSLIRKFKNSKEKVLCENDYYSYDLSSEDSNDIISKHLFNSKTPNDFMYNILPNSISSNFKKSEPISIPNSTKQFNSSYATFDINDYIGTPTSLGYINNVYNAELVNEDWIITIFYLHQIYKNYSSDNEYKIKSLHINVDWSVLSAFHHFLHNCINSTSWDFVSLIPENSVFANIPKVINTIKKKYHNNLITLLLNKEFNDINNINFIINETISKIDKINLFISTSVGSIKDYIAFIILVIKTMEPNGSIFIKIPNIYEWDTQMINILIMYQQCFQEVLIYRFNIINKTTFLLCKNKKKINNEHVYKKLLNILAANNFTNETNIFTLEYIQNNTKTELQKILNFIDNNDDQYLPFQIVMNYINTILCANTYTFT